MIGARFYWSEVCYIIMYYFWHFLPVLFVISLIIVKRFCFVYTGQVGLGVGSWPCNRATEGSNPKGTGLYFMILLKNVEKSLIGTDITV